MVPAGGQLVASDRHPNASGRPGFGEPVNGPGPLRAALVRILVAPPSGTSSRRSGSRGRRARSRSRRPARGRPPGAAGFRAVEEEQAAVLTPFPGTPRPHWDWWWELAPPLQSLLDGLSPDRRRHVTDEVVAVLRPYDDGERVTIAIQVVVAAGIR